MSDNKFYDCVKSSEDIKRWYDENYHFLSGCGLWLKGEEPNTMDAALFPQSGLKFLICRLSTYRDVSVSISHPLIAQIAREVEGVFVDFAYLPPPKDIKLMSASGVPLWVGTTTKEPPCAFDVVGISNSFVLELLNLPKLLYFSGIPLFKTERMVRSDIPFVILGGANAAVTSVLHGPVKGQRSENAYGLVDAVFIGEGEYAVKQFLEIVKKGKSAGLGKTEILNACHGKVDGFYEPDKYEHRYRKIIRNPMSEAGNEHAEEVLYEIHPKESYVSFPVKSAIVYDLDQVRTMEICPLWYEPESLGTGSLQISSGCPCFCSFCAESWERKPYRERSLSKLSEGLRVAKAYQGLDTVNLFSFNFNTHKELYPMILSFYGEIANISLKSQRFDLLSADRFLTEVLPVIGKTTISCGMEGISERLRRYLHKDLTEEQIYKACELLYERGIRELKIFLISTGLEQDEDFEEFERFVKRLMDLRSMCGSNARIIFSITPLYYPPHTPLEFHECMTALEDKKKIQREIERICTVNGTEFRESASYEDLWLAQLLAMGDRRLTLALIRSSIADDFVYYNTVPNRVIKNWRSYLQASGLSEEMYFRRKDKDQAFPWDDINMGISKEFLREEYERSVLFTEREYCLGRPHVEAKCFGCGACPDGTLIKSITHHKTSQPFLLEELHNIAKRKRNRAIFGVVTDIEYPMRLVHKRFIGVAIARALMLAMPDIVPYYHSFQGYLSDFGDKISADFTHGINIFHLAFIAEDRLKELLNTHHLSQILTRIQELCQGFKIKGFITDAGKLPDVKYLLYRMRFNSNFTKPLIEKKLGEYLHAHYVKHTLYKKGDCTLFMVDIKNRKNAAVLYARVDKAEPAKEMHGGFSLVIVATRRFDMKKFLEACYGFDRRREIMRAGIEVLGYYGINPLLQKKIRCVSCNSHVNEILIVGQPMLEHNCIVCSVDYARESSMSALRG
ncbi:MAG: radical SAM protein [Candidatus Loosdrechtia sp.]|uniref:radical SAM protein n=1 Tax=Candidatus Loosdrechtia sp. TaxID=3101272 RepID=UPI003A6DDF6B|nr:MAG: radical SAM protein [Candidatus Jettenia sp. AMX2]